jgi:hypothetical protein
MIVVPGAQPSPNKDTMDVAEKEFDATRRASARVGQP